MSGYLQFCATGERVIDDLLHLLEMAGNGYHHTNGWVEEGYGGEPSYVDQIDALAKKKAEEIAALRADLSKALGSLDATNIEITNLRVDARFLADTLTRILLAIGFPEQLEATIDRHATMNPDEIAVAELIARRRIETAGGRKQRFGATPEERFAQDRAAALAEIAVARFFNLWWSGLAKGSEGRPDVGDILEVRFISTEEKGLLINPEDRGERPFVLVLVNEHRCTLLGWLFAHEGRRPEFEHPSKREGTVFHAVPRERLRPLSLLGEHLVRRATP